MWTSVPDLNSNADMQRSSTDSYSLKTLLGNITGNNTGGSFSNIDIKYENSGHLLKRIEDIEDCGEVCTCAVCIKQRAF